MAKKPQALREGFTADEVRQMIRDDIQVNEWTQAEYAKLMGISQSFTSDVLRGHRLPGTAMIKRLNLREVILYVAR